MDNELKIRTLTEQFFNGETSQAEEQQLYAYYRQPPEVLPADLRPLQQLFLDLACLSVAASQQQTIRQKPRRRWMAAAAIAVLCAGGALFFFSRQQSPQPEEELVAYILGERTTNPDVVLGEMRETIAAISDGDADDAVEQQLKAMFSN